MDSTDDVTISSASALASVPTQPMQQWSAEGKGSAMAGPLTATAVSKVSNVMAKAAEDAAARAARAVEQSAAVHQLREQLRAVDGNRGAFRARRDEVYRVQIATNNREIAELRQRLAAGASNAAFFIAKLHQSYRAQIAARDGEIAAKDELIVEVQRRAERLAQQVARLEQKLADLRAHAEVVETQPLLPAAHPGLFRRIMSWYRRR